MSFWVEKHGYVIFFLQKLAYFTTKNNANKLKRNVFSKTAIKSVKKHWNPANSVRSKNFGQKTLKNRKKHFNCADLFIICQDNCQNAAN